jgi:hypothetical protein
MHRVLRALDPPEPRTAGDVHKTTNLDRRLAASTLTRLVKQGRTPAGDGDASSNATKRRELTSAISHTEKALEEALRVLRRESGEPAGSAEIPPMTRLSA